jgi:hypothetical protein
MRDPGFLLKIRDGDFEFDELMEMVEEKWSISRNSTGNQHCLIGRILKRLIILVNLRIRLYNC